MDVQILLVIILGLLAVSLTVVCVYVVIILKEFRYTLRKVNYIIENAHRATDSLLSPASAMIGVASTILEAIKTVKSIRTIADVTEEEDE